MSRVYYRKNPSLTIQRVKRGSGFAFLKKSGEPVSGKSGERIAKLRIPPAWVDVVVSPDPKDYIQAIGTDAKGRRQYIYHPLWVKKNQEKKFDEMVLFGERLPTLRDVVRGHMRESSLSRDRLIATVVWLLEHSFIRVGNRAYAKENHSYGLTTMRNKHVRVRGDKATFSFVGKSGVKHTLDITNPNVARTIKACIDLPGYELFGYIDDEGVKHVVDAADVNAYLKEHTGANFSAKDFRTWGGSVLAGDCLYRKGHADSPEKAKENISKAVGEVSEHLGNTKKVCQAYYIHPAVISSYERNILVPHFAKECRRAYGERFRLTPEEYATWSLIKDA